MVYDAFKILNLFVGYLAYKIMLLTHLAISEIKFWKKLCIILQLILVDFLINIKFLPNTIGEN